MTGSLLLDLWVASLIMAGLSIAVLTGLVLHRVLSSRERQRRQVRRDQMMSALFLASESRADAVNALKPILKSSKAISQALLEYATLVRGRDLDEAVAALQDAGAEKLIVRAVSKGSSKYRQMAVEALAYFNSPEAFTALRILSESLKVPAPVKVSSARSLIVMGEEPDLERLLSRFSLEAVQAPMEMAAVFQALARSFPETLISRVEQAKDGIMLRAMMIDALARGDVYSAVPVLEASAGDPEPEIRRAAIDALGRLELPIDGAIVRAALGDNEPDVRAASADAIGRVGLTEHADALVSLLSDEHWNVRFSAANALSALGPDYQRRLEALESGSLDEPKRRAASLALSERAAS